MEESITRSSLRQNVPHLAGESCCWMDTSLTIAAPAAPAASASGGLVGGDALAKRSLLIRYTGENAEHPPLDWPPWPGFTQSDTLIPSAVNQDSALSPSFTCDVR
ncbi:hypothetical protein RRG08_021229 [Elysia crispata]|uniref:Uncharacterized protein n=1 Tax=Elysia crispata TaxID=231223 RepID=A0AAE0YZU9_9GAST|nr:hypothetical protein RRG08_021229 [Elysia crispata]